jgi:hypothetical protein
MAITDTYHVREAGDHILHIPGPVGDDWPMCGTYLVQSRRVLPANRQPNDSVCKKCAELYQVWKKEHGQ